MEHPVLQHSRISQGHAHPGFENERPESRPHLVENEAPRCNPFFQHCSYLQYYVAHEDGKAVGRVAAFIDRSYSEPEVDGAIGWIGLFESIDDDSVSAALLGAAADDLEQAGAVKVIGMAVTLPDLNEVIEEYDRLHTGYTPSSHFYGLSDLRRDLGVFLLLRSRVRHRNFRYARIFVLGTIRKKNGIDALLYEKTHLAGTSMGIQLGSGSQMADTNPGISVPLSHMGDADITWRIYRHTQVESQTSQSVT